MISRPIKITSTVHADQELTQAAYNLFIGAEKGHLNRFKFSTSLWTGDAVRGAQLWVDLVHAQPDVFMADEAVIADVARMMAHKGERFDEFVDLGAGSLESFHNKALPLIEAVQPKIYRPLDLCASFLSDIVAEAARRLPHLEVRPENKDFLLDFVDSAHGPACVYWGGLTFSNIGTTGNELPLAEIRNRFQRLRRFMPQGGRALIAFDTGQNSDHLMAAYDQPAFAEFSLNLLHRITRDCPSITIDPAKWRYEPVWDPERYMVEHTIVATARQGIYLPDQMLTIARGDRFVIDHSFKFPAAMIMRIAKASGWDSATMLGMGDVKMLVLSA